MRDTKKWGGPGLAKPMRFMRMKEVVARTGLSRATIYLRMKAGGFPQSIPLGSPHIVGWLESEIDAWIEQKTLEARK